MVVYRHLNPVKKFPSISVRATQLTDAVADFIALDLRPVSVVDGHGFLKLMQVAESQFVVPCRKKMMEIIDCKYTELKCKVHGSVYGEEHVNLTTDIWTSQAGTFHLQLIIFNVMKNSLHCHHMPGSYDHTHLSQPIKDSLSEWCIDLIRST